MDSTPVKSFIATLFFLTFTSLITADNVQERQGLLVPDSPYTDWTYAGCYTDDVAKRTLYFNVYQDAPMTNTLCVGYCATQGFYYAGTEYSQECYCGNSVQNGAGLVDASDCNMACNGNASEPCGGPNRLSLFNTTLPPGPLGPFTNPGVNGYRSLGCYSDNVGARTLTTRVDLEDGAENMSVAICTSACSTRGYSYAGVEYGGECYCGDALANDGAPVVESSTCNMVCNGNTTEYCGGQSRLNIYTRRQAPDGWSLLGCYTDSVNQRTLPLAIFPPGDLTTESCLSACRGAGYVYAGTEYGGECFCGNAIGSSGGPAPDGDSQCNMPCKGNMLETCGGPNRLTFYQYGNGTIPSSSVAPPTSTTTRAANPPVSTDLPTNWTYQGCWIDNANGRILNYQQSDDSRLTIQSCIAKCSGLGYSVAGMQYSYQCFCDNFVRNGGQLASEDSQCGSSCAGAPGQKCGGGSRNSIYTNNTELTAYPVPAPQRTNLTGSWKYMGCLRDDAPVRALPYPIILNTNNSANNCLSQCSAFGYNGGGMQYGVECYCGDTRDVSAVGATLVDESECNYACSADGHAGHLCGGIRRLSYYTWQGSPLTEFDYPTGNAAGEYRFLIGGVIIPLVTQAARNGKVTFLEKAGTGPPNTTGAYELDLAQINNFTGAWRPMHVKTDIFCSASLTLPDKVGRQINVGGWALESTYGVRLYWPDGSPGVWGKNDWQENVKEVSLQHGRWYPTSMILPNGSILVVGGQEGSNGAPIPTLELLPPVGPTVFCEWLRRTDPNNLYPFMAALPGGDIFVAYYNEAIILDEVTFAVKRQLPNIPGAVNNFLAGRTYPMEGTAVLLPQYPPYTELKIMICGGSAPVEGFALDNCVTINPEDPSAQWTIERMPSKRVLSCMTALPDGTYLILNGAHQGFGGFGLASDPNRNAVLYDPRKPVNARFSVMANTTVDRLYHSEAILLDDGRVLVSGSDPEDNIHEQEYRVEVFIPPYLMDNPIQPTINISNTDWSYGQSVTITSSQPLTRVSLLGAGSSTHGNSMGQRTIFPAVSCGISGCVITAPPHAHACPPGWFQLFGLTATDVPSKAVWVRIGGDPAGIGNWPDSPSFDVPGV